MIIRFSEIKGCSIYIIAQQKNRAQLKGIVNILIKLPRKVILSKSLLIFGIYLFFAVLYKSAHPEKCCFCCKLYRKVNHGKYCIRPVDKEPNQDTKFMMLSPGQKMPKNYVEMEDRIVGGAVPCCADLELDYKIESDLRNMRKILKISLSTLNQNQ